MTSFIDNSVMVLASRFKANPEDAADPSWNLVSAALQAQLRHPITDDERVALRWVDLLHFTPAVCRHRSQYILWRSGKQRAERAEAKQQEKAGALQPVSQYNVLTNSLKAEVDQLMEEARKRLPSAFNHGGAGAQAFLGGDSDDDDDDSKPIEIFRPPAAMLVDPAQAEAEAQLLQRIQELQLDHYKKFKRWVEADISLMDSPSKQPPHSAGAAGTYATIGKNRSGLVSEDAIEDIPIEQLTIAQVGDLLDFLGISEHKPKFRRTSGKLLNALKKEDVRERFGEDFEGADILWTHLESNRAVSQGAGKPSAAMLSAKKLFDEYRNPTNTVGQRTTNLHAFEAQTAESRNRQRSVEQYIANGDISALKRAMNPYRPARPSEKVEAYDQSSTSEDDTYDSYGKRYLSAVQSDTTPINTPEKARAPVATTAAAASQRTAAAPASRTATAATAPSTAASKTSTAPAATRGARWQVQEYDDADESD